jgi:hypothetical protein
MGEHTRLVLHGLNGVMLPDAGGNQPPYFRFAGTIFRNNGQGIEVNRVLSPARTTDYVTGCTFDSQPSEFLAPWNDNKHVSRRHLAVEGSLLSASINNNHFKQSLFGIYKTTHATSGLSLLAHDNDFRGFYLAGICVESDPSQLGVLTSNDNFFEFPTWPALPSSQQVIDALAQDLSSPEQVTVGIRTKAHELHVLRNKFIQNDSAAYTSYAYANYRTRQVGIMAEGARTVIERSRLERLHEGLRLNLGAVGTTRQMEVISNLFTSCEVGCLVAGGALRYNYPYSETLVGVATSAFYSSCNTFRRLNTRTGLSYGIRTTPTSFITFSSTDPIIDPMHPAVIRNLYDYDANNSGSVTDLGLTQGGVLMQEKAGFGVADAETPTRAVDGPGKWFGRWRGRAGAGPPTPGSNR